MENIFKTFLFLHSLLMFLLSNYYSGSFMDNLIKVNNANTSLLEKFSHITFKDHQDDSASGILISIVITF